MLEYDIVSDIVDALDDDMKRMAERVARMVIDTFKQHSLPICDGINTSKQYQMVRLCITQQLYEVMWMHMTEQGLLIMFEEMKNKEEG